MLRIACLLALLVTLSAGGGSAAGPGPAGPAAGPFLRVIGTVQDGGLPHAACACQRCELARRDPSHRRLIASLAVVLPRSGKTFLIDASPDLRQQLDALTDVRDAPGGRVDRAPVDGVLLTHAHIGHYLGLAFFGFEAVHTRDLPVWSSPRMAAFLRANGPWSQLVDLGNLQLREVRPGEPIELGEGVRAVPVAAPHRDEYSDTLGFRIEGPRRTVFYLPDTDAWEAWDPPIEEVLRGVDVALLDGTFYSAGELPGRSVESIGHPLIERSLERFKPLVERGMEILFTHLNHSNPALDPGGPERERIEATGFGIAEEGREIGLLREAPGP